MNRFEYTRPATVAEAVAALNEPAARALAGGTNLVDLMKYDVAQPSRLVDINRLPLKSIEITSGGALRVGALVTNSDLAWHPKVREKWPMLSSAILAGASPQLRNAATTGGNLMQRTRCYYFYDPSTACNKREARSGCSAIGGVNRIHAILGTSDSCIAVHPSDMCVAMAALDASVEVEGAEGRRSIPMSGFHRLPGGEPERDNTLKVGELITSITVPAPSWPARRRCRPPDRPKGATRGWRFQRIRNRARAAGRPRSALRTVAAGIPAERDAPPACGRSP